MRVAAASREKVALLLALAPLRPNLSASPVCCPLHSPLSLSSALSPCSAFSQFSPASSAQPARLSQLSSSSLVAHRHMLLHRIKRQELVRWDELDWEQPVSDHYVEVAGVLDDLEVEGFAKQCIEESCLEPCFSCRLSCRPTLRDRGSRRCAITSAAHVNRPASGAQRMRSL